MSVDTNPCRHCGLLPTVTEEKISESFSEYNVAHYCPDGMVSRGARAVVKDVAIKEWNRQQKPVIHYDDDMEDWWAAGW